MLTQEVKHVPPSSVIIKGFTTLVHTVKLKLIIKVQISGKLVTSGMWCSTYSDKTRMKKMIMIIVSKNKSQLLIVLDGSRN